MSWVQEVVEEGRLVVRRIPGVVNIADHLTKVTPENEMADDIHKLARSIKGTGTMIMMTNESLGNVQKGLRKYA